MKHGKRARLGVGIAVMAATAMVGLARAETAINVTDDKPLDAQSVGPMHELALAQRLALYGVGNQDAMSLIVAARIMDQFLVSESDLQPRGGQDPAPDGGATIVSTVDEMLVAARDLAGDRQDLIALIEDVEAGGTRGTHGQGYYYYEDSISPFNALAYDEGFFGDEVAVVTLNGWSDSDLDLHIYDEFGNSVCESISHDSAEFCEWTPRWTGRFTVVVLNNGGIENTYSLWTN